MAPAPLKLGSTSINTGNANKIQALGPELSEDSSEEELVAGPSTVSRTGGMYAELEDDGGGSANEFEVEEPMMTEEDAMGDRDEAIRARIVEGQEQMKLILSSLTPEQLQRYETFRRVGLAKPTIKKVFSYKG